MDYLTLILLLVIVASISLGTTAAIKSAKLREEVEEMLPYRLKRFFFTKSEHEFFRILMNKIDHSKFTVFPKVRLGDFVETIADWEERQSSVCPLRLVIPILGT